MALYGLDLSHYQPTNAVDQAQDFVILKATEGTSYVDPDCDNKYQRAKSQGKLLGVYGYGDFTDAVQEATYFVNNVTGYLGEALLAFDNETHTDVQWALTWLNTVYQMTMVRPVIYMSASTTKAVDWSPVVNAGYALYEAGYPSVFNVLNPGLPAPDGSDMPYDNGAWPFATIWQYSDSAGTLDRDIAYMTHDAWGKFAMGDRVPSVLIPPVITPAPTPPVASVSTPVVTPPTVITPTPTSTNVPVIVNDPLPPKVTPKPTPVVKQPTPIVMAEKDAEFVWQHYNKTIMAFVGTTITYLLTRYHVNVAIPDISAILTVLGVFQVKNL